MVSGQRNIYGGLWVSLTLTQHDGDCQGEEEQEAGACQGNPDEDVAEEIRLFLLAGVCGVTEEEKVHMGGVMTSSPGAKGPAWHPAGLVVKQKVPLRENM